MIIHGYTVVPTPGTAVPLTATRQDVAWIMFFPRKVGQTTNKGEVRVGGQPHSADSGGIPQGSGIPFQPGDSAVAWPAGDRNPHNTADVYVDCDSGNGGDGVQWVAGVI